MVSSIKVIKIWKEQENSDAKAPKERIKEYFGIDRFEMINVQ